MSVPGVQDDRAGQLDPAPTILVVDDEPAVRRLVRRIIERTGWQFYEADDGEAALAMVQETDATLDAVLTDLQMPRIGGRAVAEVLVRCRPDIAVVCMTGFATDAVVDRWAAAARIPVLNKPFTEEMLIDALVQRITRSRERRRRRRAGSTSGERPRDCSDLIAVARRLSA
ncbi:MAG TPA: response regulator [Gemmatimonadales bacterium]|nr:response regulator [Gemmatimonadales bacterium]